MAQCEAQTAILPERELCSLSQQVCAGGAAASHIPAPGVMTAQYGDPSAQTLFREQACLSTCLPVLTSTQQEKKLHQSYCTFIFYDMTQEAALFTLFSSVMRHKWPDFQLIYSYPSTFIS